MCLDLVVNTTAYVRAVSAYLYMQWRTQDLKKGGVVVEGGSPIGGEAFVNVNSVC